MNVARKLTPLAALAMAAACACATPAAAGPTAGRLAGTWLGSLDLGRSSLRIVYVVYEVPGAPGAFSGVVISPDQSSAEFPLSRIEADGERVLMEAASLGATYEGRFAGANAIEGSFRQSGYDFPLLLKRGEYEKARRPQDPIPPFPYSEEEVAVDSGGFRLGGTLTLPSSGALADRGGRAPAVLLISGSGSQDRNEEIMNHRPFLVLADALARAGFAVLRLDDRGVGASGGSPVGATTLDLAMDAEAAVAFLARRKEVDASRIALCGHSEGALIAFIVAARNPGAVAAAISLAGPGVPGDELLIAQGRLIMRAEGADEAAIEYSSRRQREFFDLAISGLPDRELRAAVSAWCSEVGLDGKEAEATLAAAFDPWLRWFLACDPADYVRELRCPMLALNGELDLQVPFAENLAAIERAAKEGGNGAVEVRSFPGLNHLFQAAVTGSPSEYGSIEETFSREAMGYAIEWLAATLP
jgi:hypothetical protein